ncbi:MAG: hypothetical protein AAF927_30265 [Bacteroidota bacterium]
MKHLIFLLFPVICFAQEKQESELVFDKVYYECEDKWVAFPKADADTSYVLGFIYLDESAGFTFNLEKRFEILESGEYLAQEKITEASVKIRLGPQTSPLAIIEADKLSELGLPAVPEWLKFYKEIEDTVSSLVRRGYHYNHVGASSIAIPILEKAYKKEPQAEGLEFELAYAYNATEKYEMAIRVLREAIRNDDKNYFFFRELGYALIRVGQVEKAEEVYLKGIALSDDDFQKSEMAINMVQAYYQLNDYKKLKKWAKLTRKYAEKDSQYLEYLKRFEKNIKIRR